jgi:hypothetical protein
MSRFQVRHEVTTNKDSIAAAVPFFSAGYDQLLPHAQVATRLVTVRDFNRKITAAALLEKSRIRSVAAVREVDMYGRIALSAALMRWCHDDGSAAWASVNAENKGIQTLVRRVGMERIQDESIAADLIQALGTPKDYKIVHTSEYGGLVLVNGQSSERAGYTQQVWAWEDRIAA